MGSNLYVHFPFCRRKCAYCALPSRPGSSCEEREGYVASIADRLRRLAPRARLVRVRRKPDAKNEFFHLYKILVYGKKLY